MELLHSPLNIQPIPTVQLLNKRSTNNPEVVRNQRREEHPETSGFTFTQGHNL